MMQVPTKFSDKKPAPDLSDFRKRYPLTVANFGALANREAWLKRLWELDEGWQQARTAQERAAPEVVVRGVPPAGLSIEAEFDVIYAGGVLGLLHAAVLAHSFKRRVMVFDEQALGATGRDWNVSDEELRELERAGLFTREETDAAIVNRYRSGFVKFHDAGSRVKTPPLWIDGVLNIAVDADRLLALARRKIEESETRSALMDGLRFVRCYIQRERVVVEVEETRTRRRRLFAARLFVDATNANSAVARQLNDGRTVTHVCPTVGTISRGFVKGRESNEVDFGVGEILVSNEDARDHRQLIWEGFAGNTGRDEYATYLFFYDAINSPADKSLLALFEHYFDSLPRYKRAGAQWRVLKPVFGYAHGFNHHGWTNRRRAADDRVLLLGDAARSSSPLTLIGFGAHVRNLQKLTHLTALALDADALDAQSLSEINSCAPRVAQASSLAEFLRPTPQSAPASVNETLNAVMAALHSLDERVRRELFQDRLTFNALKNLLGHTIRLYPRILQRVREHLGARGAFWWLANVADAAFTERRERKTLPGSETQGEDAAEEFARYLRLYKNQRDGEKQRDERE